MAKDHGAPNWYNREEVIAACKATIADIDQDRSRRVEKIIDKHQTSRKMFWLFGPVVTRTREEAAAHAEEHGWDLLFARSAYDGQYKTVKEILQESQCIDGQYVQLTRNEFSMISLFYVHKVACQGDAAPAA